MFNYHNIDKEEKITRLNFIHSHKSVGRYYFDNGLDFGEVT